MNNSAGACLCGGSASGAGEAAGARCCSSGGAAAAAVAKARTRVITCASSAAGTWPAGDGAFGGDTRREHDHDHAHDHAHDHKHSSSSNGCGSGCNGHDHDHDHGHGHAHAHDHSHSHDHADGGACCGHGHSHEHFNAATERSPLLRAVGATGFFSLSEALEHGAAYSAAAVACYAASLLLTLGAGAGALPAGAGALAAVLLCVTYFLSGVPQLAETLVACVRGRVDTHVLMSLSVVGTLYMGMAAEVRGFGVCGVVMFSGEWGVVEVGRVGLLGLKRAYSLTHLPNRSPLATAGRAAAAPVPREPPAGGQTDGARHRQPGAAV